MTRSAFYDRMLTVDTIRARVEAAEATAELRASRTVTDAFDDTDTRIATENARWWLERRRRSAYGPSLDLRTVPTNVLVELLTGVNDDSDEPPPSLQQLQRERERTLLLAQADATTPQDAATAKETPAGRDAG